MTSIVSDHVASSSRVSYLASVASETHRDTMFCVYRLAPGTG